MVFSHDASAAVPRSPVQRLAASDACMLRRDTRLAPRHRLVASPADVFSVVFWPRSLGMQRAELMSHKTGPGIRFVPPRFLPAVMLRQVARKSFEMLVAAQLR